jgi:hypothetical protein
MAKPRKRRAAHGPVIAAVAQSLAYLRSDAARASIARDPYWPKWDSPWWHVLALREAGQPEVVPREVLVELVEAATRHYLPFFPRPPEVLPPGKNARTDVICFCALGSLLCAADGVATIPWADDFIVRYQLPDGGWNCDEDSRVSSIVSTVPVLEYLLTRPGLRPVLERGMTYLLERGLFRSKRTGAVIDETWLHPSLPRFYQYDVLRGLRLVARWGGAPIPREALEGLRPLRVRSWPSSDEARREHGAESSFPLCDALGRPANALPILEAELAAVGPSLA